MINVKDIRLTPEELARCIAFSRASASSQQAIEFGQKTTSPREDSEIAADTLIGKIAEVAFSKMLKENYAIDIPLDFNLYPRGKWDDQDAIINGWRIDVKGTRKGGQWMLIEWSKLDFRQKENCLAHIYAMFTVDWPRGAEYPTGRVSYQGVASLNKLRPDCKTTKIVRKGECIPGTRTKLQADNYAIHFNDLYKHLNHFVMHITVKTPPGVLTENYPNPYTGKAVMP